MTALSRINVNKSLWQTTVLLTLGFWLSSSLILDLVIMPGLYTTGMMSGSGFATAGYSIFWIFNRIELLCAALVVTGLLVIRFGQNYLPKNGEKFIILSLILLAIALIYTYILTPEMSALGIQLNLFEPALTTPIAMDRMHESYFLLELLKLVGTGTLLGWCYQQQR